MDNKKTAIYIRLSDEDNNVDGIVKAESNSVAAQRILIRDYMQRNGFSVRQVHWSMWMMDFPAQISKDLRFRE